MNRRIAKELIAVARLLAGKGEVPEAFKKQWKDKDKDNDGKENEPKPDFLKDKEKKDKKSSVSERLVAIAEALVSGKGEVPEAFKKQWKDKDKDNDGKENEPKPDFLKDKEKKDKKAAETFKCPDCGTKVLEQTGYCVKCKKKVKKADWEPIRRDVDIRMRNKEVKQSLTSYAPALSKKMRIKVVATLAEYGGVSARPRDLDRRWSSYLVIVDPRANANKYHYYVVYSVENDMGEEVYVGWNCSGRIGIIERAYDLTAKYFGGPVSSLTKAIAACEKHLRTKERKGYERIKMTRG